MLPFGVQKPQTKFIRDKDFPHINHFIPGVKLSWPVLVVIVILTIVLYSSYEEYTETEGTLAGTVIAGGVAAMLNPYTLKYSFYRIHKIGTASNIDRYLFNGIVIPVIFVIVFFILPYSFISSSIPKISFIDSGLLIFLLIILAFLYVSGWALNTSFDYAANKFMIISDEDIGYKDAGEFVDEHISSLADRIKSINDTANSYYENNQIDYAIRTLEAGISSTYYNTELLTSLIECYYDTGNTEKFKMNLKILKRVDEKRFKELTTGADDNDEDPEAEEETEEES